MADEQQHPHEDTDEPRIVINDKRRLDQQGFIRDVPSAEAVPPPAVDPALAELVADLQRLKAEYDNYRRRVERDRVAVVENATATVLAALLPVLDDVERARTHGDLVGAFGAVGDALTGIVTKLGLESYGDVGEPFDPTIHEALVHTYDDGVAGPTAVEIYRPGYRFAGRVLRAAQVVVADPPDGVPDVPQD